MILITFLKIPETLLGFLIPVLAILAVKEVASQTEEPKRYISDAERAAFEENQIYNTAGIEVKPEFPGGQEALERFLKDNYKNPRKDLKGKELRDKLIALFGN